MWNRAELFRWKAGVLCREVRVRCRKAGLLYSKGGRLKYDAGERLECGAGRLDLEGWRTVQAEGWSTVQVEGYSRGAGRLEYCKMQVEGRSTMQVEKDEVLYRRKLKYSSSGRLAYFTFQGEGWSTVQVEGYRTAQEGLKYFTVSAGGRLRHRGEKGRGEIG